MSKRDRVVCGPYLPGTAPTQTTEGGCDETNDEDEADTTYPQFPVYPEGAPTEAWDTLRLHLGHVVHQAAFDLNLPIYAVAAAVSAFHAVFPGHFTKDELCSSPHIVSRCMAACLFLAGKTSETNLKLREAVNCIDFLQWKLQQQHRLNTAATGNPQEKQHESSEDSGKTGATNGSSERKSSCASSVSSSLQQCKAEEQRDDGASGSSAPSATDEEEGKNDTDRTGQLNDESKKVNAGASDSGTKPGVKGGQPEEGSANEEGSSAGAARSQSQKGEPSKSRVCGIASFSRSSRYLKGYVPMGIREYWHVRQECLREEERLLQALGFSLPLPYLYDVLLEALVLLLPTHQEAHLIWAIANDLSATPLLEQFSPPVLIAAAALCAKKLLSVAASFPSINHEGVSASTSPSGCSVVPQSPACKTPKDATLAAEPEPSGDLTSSHPRSTCSGSGSTSSNEVLPANPLVLRCKAEPQEEGEGKEVPGTVNPTTAPGKSAREKAGKATATAPETLVVGSGTGERVAAAPNAASEEDASSASKAEEGMLEVLERLDPLLCGSPEYWALCKGHERRGLERGGSRWARALPPAALGWTLFTPQNPAAAAGDCTGAPPTVDAAAAKPAYPSAACGTSVPLAIQRPACLKADETTSAAEAGYVAAAPASEEQAERRRLLKEKQEDQRQRKLVYVQVAEACARLMEVYSLLLKSQRAPCSRSPPTP